MRQPTVKRGAVLLSTVMLLSATLCLASCGETWSWLWSRDTGIPVDTNDMILGGVDTSSETDIVFEGAVEYTGEAHSGTDIYYLGKAGSENRNRIIVIDAGHQLKGSSDLEPNGPDSEVMKAEVTWGATGVYTGEPEYELNLRVALLLRDELIRRGYSVVMIRETNNVSISNMERAQIANKYNAAAYIRIHANSWTDETMSGAMTICQSAANPYPTCAAHYEQSRLLSELVLDEFCAQTGIKQLNRREMDDMTGTNWSQVPTTIVEMGFLSNKSDDRLMATDYFRQEAAIGIANGLDAYFARLEESETEPETSRTAQTSADLSTKPSTDVPTQELTQATDDAHAATDAAITELETLPGTDPDTAETPSEENNGEAVEDDKGEMGEDPPKSDEPSADVPAEEATEVEPSEADPPPTEPADG